MAWTRAKIDNDDDEPTTNKTATSDDEHNSTHDEPRDKSAEEEEDESGLDDKESPHETTDDHDDDTLIHSAETSTTTTTAATASSTTNAKTAKKKAKLARYRQAEKRRELRMKIRENVYKDVSPDLNVSDSEAESTDADLQDIDLKPHRTKTLKRKYKSQATTKHKNEMKQHSIQQKGFTTKLFEGTPTSLESLMIELEMTASTWGWNKLFMIRMNVSPGWLDTLNFFSNKAKAEPGKGTCYYSRRQDSKKERANVYKAIMASITSTVKESYIYDNTTNNQCGIHLAVWLFSKYAMDPNQRKVLLMTQIGSLDITKSKTLLAFLSYTEKLGHTGRNLGYNDKENLHNAVEKEILILNHTSMTTVITT